jgi:hypothetical protein
VVLQCGQTRVGEPTTVLHPVHSLRPFPSGVPGTPEAPAVLDPLLDPLLSLLSLFFRSASLRASSRDDEGIRSPFGTDLSCSESFVTSRSAAAAAAAAAAFAALFAAARAAAASRWPLAAASRAERSAASRRITSSLLSRVRLSSGSFRRLAMNAASYTGFGRGGLPAAPPAAPRAPPPAPP